MFLEPHPRINGARILRLIRDAETHNMRELYEALFPEMPEFDGLSAWPVYETSASTLCDLPRA